MRVLYLYCHPLEESYHAAILARALAGLAHAGHHVDLIDLYADGFDPVVSAQARRDYHDLAKNKKGLEDYIARLRAADALVVQFPVWSFGPPAMLKGFFDRMLKPGVAFDISDPANVRQLLGNIKRVVGITTYGRPRWNAILIGDPPRRMVKRYLRAVTGWTARAQYLALYHMNVADEASRRAFMARVERTMTKF